MSQYERAAPVVECVALTKVFSDFWGRSRVLAVDSLDLDIRAGEVFGLLGPNGSGKSTTIKMLLGLLYPTTGSARIFGRPPTDTSIKSRIGFMPEESYLYRFLNAYETLDYYGRLFKLDRHERRRRIEQLIEMVGLKRAGRRPVGTYSKGMARRIGLAQALINDPDLLILDEPTTGLDPIGTRQIKDVIVTLASRGKTILLCSHLLADVEDVCSRVAIMYGGRRQAIGSISDLLVRSEVTQITARSLDEATVLRIRDIVARAGREVLAVDHPRDRLEDMFLRVVGQAQREKLSTSGAESTGGVSSFLAGEDESRTGRNVVEALVDAGGRRDAGQSIEAVPVPIAVSPREDVLEKLTSDRPVALPEKSAAPATVKTEVRPDQSVLDRLIKPSARDGDGRGK
jgi:ABC-2 type transport system ATP-binding protein